jgi:hypothetical protein
MSAMLSFNNSFFYLSNEIVAFDFDYVRTERNLLHLARDIKCKSKIKTQTARTINSDLIVTHEPKFEIILSGIGALPTLTILDQLFFVSSSVLLQGDKIAGRQICFDYVFAPNDIPTSNQTTNFNTIIPNDRKKFLAMPILVCMLTSVTSNDKNWTLELNEI